MNTLQGKVAVISGGARGQGEAEARLFVERGASVVIGDVLVEEGTRVADDLGGACRFCRLDVGEPDDWSKVMELAIAEFGAVHVLVNNAAIVGRTGDISTISKADFLETVRVNELGPFLGMRAAAPTIRAAGGGSIINVSSTAGVTGYPGTMAYAASKWALRGMSRVAAMDLAPEIRVNTVLPGPVDTPMIRSEGVTAAALQQHWDGLVPLGRVADPREIAYVVAFLASDDASFMTGAELMVDGGRTAGPARAPAGIRSGTAAAN